VRDRADILRRLSGAETITDQERRKVVILAERPEITVTWSRYAPGERGPDLHVHREHTDAFYVLEGELAFVVGREPERVRVGAGGFVAVPANVVHAFANDGTADAVWLNMHAPEKGFADYLRALRDGAHAAFDSFDPPADGGLPATAAIVSAPGVGERLASGRRLLKGAVPDLGLEEWTLGGAADLPDRERRIDSCYVLEGTLDATVDGAVHTAGPDTLVSIPRGARAAIAGKARFVHFHVPG
jgi:quercetin dioxygenase-like cupin family protein